MWESTNNDCTDKDWVLCFSRQSDPNDFQVGIMTDTQKDFLLNYGPKLLGIDTTFNVSKTSLKLTIIVVLDEFDTGIPVAMFLSQTTKKDNLKLFFSSLISKPVFFRFDVLCLMVTKFFTTHRVKP